MFLSGPKMWQDWERRSRVVLFGSVRIVVRPLRVLASVKDEPPSSLKMRGSFKVKEAKVAVIALRKKVADRAPYLGCDVIASHTS